MLGKTVIVTSLLLGCFVLGSMDVANANQSKRSGKWESTFQLSNTQSFGVDGDGGC